MPIIQVQQTTSIPPRHITVGAFFDRFGSKKLEILADTNPLVQALIKDCLVRKFIDLENPELQFGLDLLISAGHEIDKELILSAEILDREYA